MSKRYISAFRQIITKANLPNQYYRLNISSCSSETSDFQGTYQQMDDIFSEHPTFSNGKIALKYLPTVTDSETGKTYYGDCYFAVPIQTMAEIETKNNNQKLKMRAAAPKSTIGSISNSDLIRMYLDSTYKANIQLPSEVNTLTQCIRTFDKNEYNLSQTNTSSESYTQVYVSEQKFSPIENTCMMSAKNMWETLSLIKNNNSNKNKILNFFGFYDLLDSIECTTCSNGEAYLKTNETIDKYHIESTNHITIGEISFDTDFNTSLIRGISDGGYYDCQFSCAISITCKIGDTTLFDFYKDFTFGQFDWPVLSKTQNNIQVYYSKWNDEEPYMEQYDTREITINLKNYVSVSNNDNNKIDFVIKQYPYMKTLYDEQGNAVGSEADFDKQNDFDELTANNIVSMDNSRKCIY